ncbi:MAG: polysaccharide pyruvyl transferase family protein, partial [Christensenellales bacterium]
KERFKRDFEQFDFLAVREPEGAKIIRDLTGREAAVVLDPTLLLTAEEWREAEEPLDLKKPFIFVYMLGASSRMLRFATTLKKKTGMQLVFCPFPVGKPPISRWYPFISPAKWLWLMRNASYVVTNSFHGTAFSLNYEKKFFVDISDNLSTLSSRITRLLSLTGQENRLIGHGAEEAIDTEIDYAPVRAALGRERERSRAYLLDMLAKSDTNGGEA